MKPCSLFTGGVRRGGCGRSAALEFGVGGGVVEGNHREGLVAVDERFGGVEVAVAAPKFVPHALANISAISTTFSWEGQGDLDYLPSGAGDVGLDALLDGAVGVVENHGGVSAVEAGGEEGPSDVLEDYGHGGGGIVDDGIVK
nr:hypothetical protein Iba_chr01dCG4330 [Ipomoea batatas]